MTSILESLLLDRNDPSWTSTKPAGSEGDEFFKVLEKFFGLIAEHLRLNLLKGDVVSKTAFMEGQKSKLGRDLFM